MNWSLITSIWSLVLLFGACGLSLILLVYPMFRSYPDDQGDGDALVLLPKPQIPSGLRTASFAAIFIVLEVVERSITGPLDPNTMYANAVIRLVSTAVAAPAELTGYFKGFNLGLRFLMAATMVALALVCRGSLWRRLLLILQAAIFLLVMLLVDAVITVVSVIFSIPVAPTTFLGNFFAIAIGFLAMARMLFANFALPKPTVVPFRPRPRAGDAIMLISCTLVSMSFCASMVIYLYELANPGLKVLVVIAAPVPFSYLAFVIRSVLLLAAKQVTADPEPPVGDWWPRIDVIIPAYNEEEVIRDTLLAIDVAAGNYGGTVGIILANDGSTDRTFEIASETMAAFSNATGRIIAVKHGGKSATLNSALRETTADLIVRIDADTLITEWALYWTPRWFRDERVGLVEAMMWPRWRKSPFPRMRMFEEQKQFGLLHRSMTEVDGVNVVPGVFTAFRRKPALDLGGFTAGMNGEDGDFTMRMSRLGWKIRQDRRMVVEEDVPPTFMEIREQRIRWDRATIHNQARHGPYRAGIATPKVWFNQTHMFFLRVFGPVRFTLPIYLLVLAVFEGTWRVPILVAFATWVFSQAGFMLLESALTVAYHHERHLAWVLLWPLWQICLTIFSTEAIISLPPRPASIRTGTRPEPIAQFVIH